MVNAAENCVGSQTAVPLEENAKLIFVSSFMQGDTTVMHVRLHICTIQEALRDRKTLCFVQGIRALCQHQQSLLSISKNQERSKIIAYE
jgi:hypothetical protein